MLGAQRGFLAGLRLEGEAGGERFFDGTAAALTRPIGVDGPRLFVRR